MNPSEQARSIIAEPVGTVSRAGNGSACLSDHGRGSRPGLNSISPAANAAK